jgi:hypothetical protein
MKKFFYVLMAAAALVAVSCDKEGNEGTNEGENGGDVVELAQPTHRIKTMTSSGGDVFYILIQRKRYSCFYRGFL